MRSMTICVSGKYASVIYDSDAKYMLVLPMCGDDDKFDFEQFTLELRRRTQKPLAFVFYAIEEPERELIPLFSEPLPGGEPFEHANETLDIIENAMIPEVIRRLHLSRDIKTVLGGCSLAGLFSLWAAHMTDSFYAVAAVSPALAVPGWKDFADKYPLLAKRVYVNAFRDLNYTKNALSDHYNDLGKKLFAGSNDLAKTRCRFFDRPLFSYQEYRESRLAEGLAWCVGYNGFRIKDNCGRHCVERCLEMYYPEEGEENVVIPDGVELIDEEAFMGCTNIKSVHIPDSVKTIGSRAFMNCSRLESIRFSKRNKTAFRLPITAFRGTPWYEDNKEEFLIVNGVLLKYNGKSAVVKLPENVRYIGDEVFAENDTVEQVILPEGFKNFGCSVFRGCSRLKEINLPENVKETDRLFKNCVSLSHIELPDTIISIGHSAFEGTSLESVVFPSQLEEIMYIAFKDTRLRNVFLPDTVTMLWAGAFKNCKELTEFSMPKTAVPMNGLLFEGSDNIEHFVIRDLFDLRIPRGRFKSVGHDLSVLLNLTVNRRHGTLSWDMHEIADEDFRAYYMFELYIQTGMESIKKYLLKDCTENALLIPQMLHHEVNTPADNADSLTAMMMLKRSPVISPEELLCGSFSDKTVSLLRRRHDQCFAAAVLNGDIPSFDRLAELGPVSGNLNFDALVRYTSENEMNEMTAMLLKYIDDYNVDTNAKGRFGL